MNADDQERRRRKWQMAELAAAAEPLEDLHQWLAEQAVEHFAPDTPEGRVAASVAGVLVELVIEHIHPALILVREVMHELDAQTERDHQADWGHQRHAEPQAEPELEAGG